MYYRIYKHDIHKPGIYSVNKAFKYFQIHYIIYTIIPLIAKNILGRIKLNLNIYSTEYTWQAFYHFLWKNYCKMLVISNRLVDLCCFLSLKSTVAWRVALCPHVDFPGSCIQADQHSGVQTHCMDCYACVLFCEWIHLWSDTSVDITREKDIIIRPVMRLRYSQSLEV